MSVNQKPATTVRDKRVNVSTVKRTDVVFDIARVIEAVARAHWRTVKAVLARETGEAIGDD